MFPHSVVKTCTAIRTCVHGVGCHCVCMCNVYSEAGQETPALHVVLVAY